MQTPIANSAEQSPLGQLPSANTQMPDPMSPNVELPALEKPPSAQGDSSSQALVPAGAAPLPPLPRTQTKNPLAIASLIGELDLRTPAEEVEFRECEVLVGGGWAHFAQMGGALIRIRDKQLYKNEYRGFEQYCQERWGFGRAQAGRYISAAQVHQTLGALSGIPMPECEAQVRPLIRLPAELAQQAWLEALGRSRDGYVPARLVKRAVKKVLKTEQPPVAAESTSANRQQRRRLRQSVRSGFQELLTLLLGGAERDVLIAKVQAIERLLDPLLNPKKTKA